MSTVLVLARETPSPPSAGDRIVTHGFVRGLAERGHDVHVVAYGDETDRGRAEALTGVGEVEADDRCRSDAPDLRESDTPDFRESDDAGPCKSVRLVPRAESRLPPRLRKLRNYAVGRSDVMGMFASPSLTRATQDRIRDLEPDAVLAEHPYIGQVFRDPAVREAADDAGAFLVTNAHVVEFAVHRRYRDLAEGLETRAELAAETPLLRREELAVYEASDRVLVLGSEDGTELEQAGVSTPIATQHVGLDPDDYEPADYGSESVTSTDEEREATHLLFFGSYGWFPNEDAVTTFADAGFPLVRDRRPDARLAVAGRNAPESVRKLGERPGVTFVGEVADLAGAVRDAAAVIAPLRIGGGTRLKVLESMAWGAPVVTTGAGFEGVDARPDADVAVAADWNEFADRTVELLDSPERRARLGRNARRRVEQVYALDDAAAELEMNLGLDGAVSSIPSKRSVDGPDEPVLEK